MKLLKLTLTNFKGCRSLCLDTEGGKSVSVYGDNATFKTTIFDAFLWLLFEKNSLGAKDFEIKTRDENGEVIPALNHEVEGVFDIDGKEVVLKRVYLEKYTRRRGSAEQEFTGHVTEHFVDGVPRSKGEYQAFVDGIAPEKLFMCLANPTHFNEALSWQDRRKMLLGLCPAINDADIIAAHPELAPLAQLLETRDIDDAKKVEMATRKKINEELTGIPGRIDEATRAIPENATGNLEQLMIKAKKLAADINSLREKKISTISGGDVAQKQKELAEIENDILTLRNKHLSAAGASCDEERQHLHTLSNEIQALELKIDADKRKVEQLAANVEQCKEFSRNIAARWTEQNGLVFSATGNCPTCGQDYPAHLLHKQEADFNRTKATALELIVKEGKDNEAEWKRCTTEILEINARIVESCHVVENKKVEAEQLRSIIASKATPPPVETLPEFIELDNSLKEVSRQFSELNASSYDAVSSINADISEKQQNLDGINATITAIETADAQRRRIDELKAREKELAEQFEQSEHILYLIDLFIQAKVGMLEESINGKFAMVRWKLFDTLINNGVQETCICTVHGVSYPSVNNGAKIKSGAEIISVFQKHYSITSPVFFDNAESVVELQSMDCQQIKLIVSEKDKQLRIEV